MITIISIKINHLFNQGKLHEWSHKNDRTNIPFLQPMDAHCVAKATLAFFRTVLYSRYVPQR